MRQRRPALHSIHFRIEGTQAHGVSEPLDCIIGFALHDFHEAAEELRRSEIRIEKQSPVDKRDAGRMTRQPDTRCGSHDKVCRRVPSWLVSGRSLIGSG
jgi:hypothetical protein